MVIGVGQVKGAGEGVSARWVESAMWSEGVDGRSECGCGYDERGGVGEGGGGRSGRGNGGGAPVGVGEGGSGVKVGGLRATTGVPLGEGEGAVEWSERERGGGAGVRGMGWLGVRGALVNPRSVCDFPFGRDRILAPVFGRGPCDRLISRFLGDRQ